MPPSSFDLAAFDFDAGTVVFTEAGSKKRASIHVVSGEAGLAELDDRRAARVADEAGRHGIDDRRKLDADLSAGRHEDAVD